LYLAPNGKKFYIKISHCGQSNPEAKPLEKNSLLAKQKGSLLLAAELPDVG